MVWLIGRHFFFRRRPLPGESKLAKVPTRLRAAPLPRQAGQAGRGLAHARAGGMVLRSTVFLLVAHKALAADKAAKKSARSSAGSHCARTPPARPPPTKIPLAAAAAATAAAAAAAAAAATDAADAAAKSFFGHGAWRLAHGASDARGLNAGPTILSCPAHDAHHVAGLQRVHGFAATWCFALIELKHATAISGSSRPVPRRACSSTACGSFRRPASQAARRTAAPRSPQPA